MSFPRYPAYKDSGLEWLGEVPEHWEEKPLKTVTSINDEVLSESVSIDHEIEYVDISSVSLANGIERTESVIFGDAPSRARRIPRDGDVLVSTVRTYLKAIAPVVSPPCNLVASTGFAVVRPQRGIHPGYLKYALQEEHFIQQVISRSTGVSYPAINASDIARIPLSLPKQSEQLAIATFLDRETAKIDALIAEQQRLIELLQEKRQAVISHAVTKGLNPDAPMKDSGVEWLGEVPEHWEVCRIKNVGKSVIGLTYSPSDVTEAESGIPVLRASNIQDGRLDWEDTVFVNMQIEPSLLLRPGDILICARSGSRDLIGKNILIAESDLAMTPSFGAFMTVLRCIDPPFLRWALSSTIFKAQSGAYMSTTINQLTSGTLMGTTLALPPNEERGMICQYLDNHIAKVDGLVSECRQAVSLLQVRRSALISAAVTGQIDVRGLVPEAEAA